MIVHDDELCTLYLGDCVEVMRELPADSVDAIVTDPPYWLSFMGKAWDGGLPDEDAGFGYYFSGLVDGEGHFRVQAQARGTYSCAFSIHLRKDDEAILQQVRRFLGVGSITYDQTADRSPMARLNVQAKADCLRVVEVLTRYPLRAKKLRDFLPWAEAVLEWNEMKRGHRWSGRGDWSRLEKLKATIERAREYREIPWSGNSYQDWTREWAEEALRVLKPGGHLLSFSGTRTYHRMTCGLEDAGWEIRDCLVWAYASGFPKSLDVSKAIDKAAGAEREVVRTYRGGIPKGHLNGTGGSLVGHGTSGLELKATAPATPDAEKWNGWGTALKPAWEPIVMARKPLRGTVAANVLLYSTGAINIQATRIGANGSGDEGRDGEASARTFCVDCLPIVRGDVPGSEALAGADEGSDLLSGLPLQDDDRAAEQAVSGWLPDAAGLPDRVRPGRQARPRTSAGDRAALPPQAAPVRGGPSPEPRQERQPARQPSGDGEGHPRGQASRCARCDGPLAPARWPSNVLLSSPIFDGDTPGVVGGGSQQSGYLSPEHNRNVNTGNGLTHGEMAPIANESYGDSGTYSRFFLVPKSSRSDREPVLRPDDHNGTRISTHPTMKPTALMRHLVRLVTPPGGTVLDCFLGSGTTAIAAEMEGFAWIGIEKEAEYVAIAEARLNGTQRGLGLDVPAPTRKVPFNDDKSRWPTRKTRTKRWTEWVQSTADGDT